MERTLLSVSSLGRFPFPTSGISYSSSRAYHFPSSLSCTSSWLPCNPQFSPSLASTGIPRKRSRRNSHFSCRCCRSSNHDNVELESSEESSFDCLGTGQDVECLVSSSSETESRGDAAPASIANGIAKTEILGASPKSILEIAIETGVLVSPFFFWGSSMVAMKDVIPMAGPFFVAAFRLLPSGLLLIAFAASNGRPLPSGLLAWLSIALFALVDAACFQQLLTGISCTRIAEDLRRLGQRYNRLAALDSRFACKFVVWRAHRIGGSVWACTWSSGTFTS